MLYLSIEKNENNRKEAGLGPFFNLHRVMSGHVRSEPLNGARSAGVINTLGKVLSNFFHSH